MYHSSINLQDPFCQLIPLRPLWTSPQWYPHLSSSPHSWCCPVGVASISPPRIWQFKCHMRLAQKFGTLSKKKDVGQESLFFCDLSSCMGSDTLTSPAGNLCAYIFSTKCPRRPLRSTRSRTKDLLPFRRSPSPWFPGAESWRKNQLGRRGAHIVIVWKQLHLDSWKSKYPLHNPLGIDSLLICMY